MSSSTFRRLHGIFAANKVTPTPRPKAPKSTTFATPAATSVAVDQSHRISSSDSPPEDKDFVSIVKKFKKASRSSRFRHHKSVAYQTTVRRLAAAKKFSYIEDIIEHQKQYDDITSEGFTVRLLSLYGKSGMFDHARKLFDEMPQLSCERTVKSFNALLSACVNAKKFDKIAEIFNDLPEKLSIKPNTISFNTVVKAFCEMGAFDSAFSVIEEMEKNGLGPDLITFNTLLHALYSNDRFSDAERVWAMMEDKNVVTNSRSYNPKLRALVASGRFSEAVDLIEEMKSKGVEPDTHSFNSLIKGFCEDGNMEEAKRWFGEMAKNGCKPDRVTYVLLGYLACNKGDFDYAFELCKEAINGRLVIHKTLAQLVVDGLVEESKVKGAKELVELGNSNTYYNFNLQLPSN